jgi:hypothetical protein
MNGIITTKSIFTTNVKLPKHQADKIQSVCHKVTKVTMSTIAKEIIFWQDGQDLYKLHCVDVHETKMFHQFFKVLPKSLGLIFKDDGLVTISYQKRKIEK